FAQRGIGRETHIDTSKREIRFARRSAGNKIRVKLRVPFSEIESVFVRRNEAHQGLLRLRVRGASQALTIVAGVERELNLMHSRLCRDLKSPEERLEMRLKLVRPEQKVAVKLRQRRMA
ncbi:MAG: hypothetical protein AAGO57_00465, partial [Pseudomonadota bacterium]